MSSNLSKRLTIGWPDNISFDKADGISQKIYSQSEGLIRNDTLFKDKTGLDIFLMALAIGKGEKNEGIPVEERSISMPKKSLTDEMIWLMTCVAFLKERGELSLLQEPNKIPKICEEYANRGIKKIKQMEDDAPLGDPLGPYESYLEELLNKM